ncbi:DUF664 domain-containing protein [Labedella populi]|uniref:DUF664 domain-containing protein n=1 Tax=Labedella populi TaxID=2498850 RepID=A0A444QDP9_9MICO|nr:DUF664 domain-containing protein [Labedella populi]
MLTTDDYVYFAVRALEGMAGIVRDLGDDLANTRPNLPGANTPYALLVHCLGVVEYWAGHLVRGRPSERDREAEFDASGAVDVLLQRTEEAIGRLAGDVAAASPSSPLAFQPAASAQGPDRPLTQGAALQHVYEELAQHHGQMELMRDVILAERAGLLVGRS